MSNPSNEATETAQEQDGAATAISNLVRFGVRVLVALGALFFVADLLIIASNVNAFRFLTETLLIAMISGIAAMVGAGILAILSLALWKR